MSELGISSLCKPRGELQSEIANCVVKEHRAEKCLNWEYPHFVNQEVSCSLKLQIVLLKSTEQKN